MSGGTLTGALYFKTTSQVTLEALNVKTSTTYFGQMGNPYVETISNMVNHKIINLADLTDNKNDVKKQFWEQEIQKSQFFPFDKFTNSCQEIWVRANQSFIFFFIHHI